MPAETILFFLGAAFSLGAIIGTPLVLLRVRKDERRFRRTGKTRSGYDPYRLVRGDYLRGDYDSEDAEDEKR